MDEYLETIENKMLRNLLMYPPVEGSRDAHEAWKQNVRFLLDHGYDPSDTIWNGLRVAGFVTATLRNECISFAKTLPFERKC